VKNSQHIVEPIHQWIWRYLRPYRRGLAGLAGLSLVEVGLRVLSPWPLKIVVDYVVGDRPLPPAAERALAPFEAIFAGVSDRQTRLLCAVVFAGASAQVVHQLVMMVHSRVQSATGHRMVRDLRERLFGHVQAMTLSQHARQPAADLLYRLEWDACCLEHLVLRGVFPIAFTAITLAAMFAILVHLDPQLAFISLGVVPVLFLWRRFYTVRMQPAARAAKQCESALVQRLHETLAAIRLVKCFGREEFEQHRFSATADHALRARLVTTRQDALFAAVVTILTVIGTAVVILTGGLSVLHGRISLGTLLILIAYLGFVYGPLCHIASTTGALQQAVASARRVCEAFTLPVEPPDAPSAVSAEGMRGEIVFDGVTFAYAEGTAVLNGVSFSVSSGQMVALVGPSGAGKTTIANLMLRLYDADEGRVLLDGRDVRDYRLLSLRQAVALVSQDSPLFSGAIRENLRYGRLDATDAELEDAARAAHAHDFIVDMAGGYDARLGDSGGGLSAGQRQRLALARALVKDAPVLVLDEPTAALDAVSEASVIDGLRRFRRNRTTIVIAHRLSTVRAADTVVVVEKGRVVAQGTHQELVVSAPLYARLVARMSDDGDARPLLRAG
jgi:ABC-type multidrug transport system fused ATPase/permease subunit